MKKIICLFVLSVFLVALNPMLLYSQERLSINAGAGFSELFNVGVSYNANQFEFGASYGLASFLDEQHKSMNSTTGFFKHHFGAEPKQSSRKLWFMRYGLSYMWGETQSVIYDNVILDVRIGRDFNLSDKLGLDLGIGPAIVLYEKEVYINNPPFLDLNWWLFPSIGMRFFYKI